MYLFNCNICSKLDYTCTAVLRQTGVSDNSQVLHPPIITDTSSETHRDRSLEQIALLLRSYTQRKENSYQIGGKMT